MSLLKQTKERLRELKSDPKRSLGQNFLIDAHVVDQIISAVKELKPIALVEVGPGLGALTENLVKLNVPLQLLEMDRAFVEYWQGREQKVTEEDALRLDWEKLNLVEPTVLVSNLPYQISTHIVVDRCFGPTAINAMVLMFQKEVAQRLQAKPRNGDYGLLSVMAQSHWHITKVVDAGPSSFFPAPKVASQVLKFERKPAPFPEVKPFLSFLKVSFAHRRKLLAKNLLALEKTSSEKIAAALTAAGIGPKARAEELSVEQFHQLFRSLKHGN